MYESFKEKQDTSHYESIVLIDGKSIDEINSFLFDTDIIKYIYSES